MLIQKFALENVLMVNNGSLAVIAITAFFFLLSLVLLPDLIAIYRGAQNKFEGQFDGHELEILVVLFTFPYRMEKACTAPAKFEERGWSAIGKAFKPQKNK